MGIIKYRILSIIFISQAFNFFQVGDTLYDDMFFVIRKVYRIKTAPSEAFNDLQENVRKPLSIL